MENTAWQMTNFKECEYCQSPFLSKDVRRNRLCASCEYNKADIDTVRGLVAYGAMTQQMKEQVAERAARRGSRGHGSHFNIQRARAEAGL